MFDQKEYNREWAKKNKDKVNEYQRKWSAENKEKRKEIVKNCKMRNLVEFNRKHADRAKKWRALNPDKVKAGKERRREQSAKYRVDKYNSDPVYNIACRVRARLSEMFRSGKPTTTSSLIGCTFEILKLHLESKFLEGMTWGNKNEWHIDHIVPLASATSEEEVEMLAHYTNLQPLWKRDNLIKNDSIHHLSSPWPRVA